MAEKNRDAQLEGSWDQMRGRVREAWGALTDDDVERARGNWDRLVGVVRERSGESLETVEAKLNEILDRVQESGAPQGESGGSSGTS